MKKQNYLRFDRRQFLLNAMAAAGGIGLRSLMTGLPVAFLSNRVMADPNSSRFLIYCNSGGGDPVNCNIPGTYVPGYVHPPEFETPVDLMLGSQTFKAASVWNNLVEPLKASSNFFHIRTNTNSHIERDLVMTIFGAIKPISRRTPEMLPSVVSFEQSAFQKTLLRAPISLGGSLKYDGQNQKVYAPTSFSSLFPSTLTANQVSMRDFRDQQLDLVYKDLKANGTPAQKKFLDNHALSRQEAKALGNNLSKALATVNGNDELNQAKTAAAILALSVTPVVTMGINFGGDNHNDITLSGEAASHTSAINTLNELYNALAGYGIQNKTNFAMINVFGRTPHRNARGGRDHHGDHSIMYSFGPDIRPGMIGDIKPGGRFNYYQSQGINSLDGGVTNPDILPSETHNSAAKSLLVACGLSEAGADTWIKGGKVVKAYLKK